MERCRSTPHGQHHRSTRRRQAVTGDSGQASEAGRANLVTADCLFRRCTQGSPAGPGTFGPASTGTRCLLTVSVPVCDGDQRRPPAAAPPGPVTPRGPRCPGIARRLYAAVRDLPIISPHGHVDPRLLLDDEPFPDPAIAVRDPRPLRHPVAARQRGRAGRARRWPRAAARGAGPRGVAGALRALGGLPGHPGAFLARGRAGRHLRRGP